MPRAVLATKDDFLLLFDDMLHPDIIQSLLRHANDLVVDAQAKMAPGRCVGACWMLLIVIGRSVAHSLFCQRLSAAVASNFSLFNLGKSLDES